MSRASFLGAGLRGDNPAAMRTEDEGTPAGPARLSGISCFLPAYNEEANIARVVREALLALPLAAEGCEVIVVNDGSRDRTGEIADALAREDPRVRAVHHPVNRGYGGAVKTGLAAGRFEWLLLCDGDGQFRLAEVVRLAARAAGHDAVLGYRKKRQDTALRRFNGAAWTLLMDLLLGLRVRDVDCAFKLLRRSVAGDLALRADGAMISAELLARLRRCGARIAEVPVTHLPRTAGVSTGGNPRVILRAFRELLRIRGSLPGVAGGSRGRGVRRP
jgi:glycosyltransferase involved in cell wall biosynthesis